MAILLAPPYFHTPFRFTGNGREYFRIWIVNLLLTILTLGIYSAWAKVRKQRYFYSNTWLEGEPFDYLADPVKILKGRLLALAIFGVYILIASADPLIGLLLTVAALVFYPWLFVMATRFKWRNSAYRNIRFDFRGTPFQAAAVFIKSGLVVLLTLGFGTPYFEYKRRDLVVSNTTYGTTPFTFSATAGNFFGIYIRALGLVLVGVLIFFAVATVAFTFIFATSSTVGFLLTTSSVVAEYLAAFLLTAVYFAVYSVAFVYRNTAMANLVFSNIANDRFKLKSDLAVGAMIKLYLINGVVIVASLGLMIPWAAIRMARYRIEHLTLLHHGDLDDFIAGEQEQTSAAGEEIAEIFDFDIGL
ncbi:MAG: DUF898 domain-containing protein [Candidatus Marinimicrobia bacterium]|nr:DUF898 domain-containing protein [Candidatus Neomarinimicrobiota bacterium]